MLPGRPRTNAQRLEHPQNQTPKVCFTFLKPFESQILPQDELVRGFKSQTGSLIISLPGALGSPRCGDLGSGSPLQHLRSS